MFGKRHLCDMDRLTPEEAFRHFLENYKGRKEKEIQEAKYALEGKRPYGLGVRRIKNLLDRYAPGIYEFHKGEPYFTKK